MSGARRGQDFQRSHDKFLIGSPAASAPQVDDPESQSLRHAPFFTADSLLYIIDKALLFHGGDYMKYVLVCQLNFGPKIWGAVSVIIAGRNVECF
jgi:hypothetical protein